MAEPEGAATEADDTVVSAANKRARAPAVLATVITVGFFGAFVALLILPLPSDSKEALFLMIGALIAAFSTVVGFYYGSSASNKMKDETIHSLSK